MIRAIYYPEHQAQFWEAYRTPGSFRLIARETPGLCELQYWCPCGCGLRNSLLVGKGHKPGGDRPSWRWNESTTEPTLDPSVNVVGHWHGWLRDGYWRGT
jgi:hypothetical protein